MGRPVSEALGDEIHAPARHRAAVEGEEGARGQSSVTARIGPSIAAPLRASAKITLRMFRASPQRPSTTARPVPAPPACPPARHGAAASVCSMPANGSARASREAPPLFPCRFAAALVLFRERGQKLRLGVDPRVLWSAWAASSG